MELAKFTSDSRLTWYLSTLPPGWKSEAAIVRFTGEPKDHQGTNLYPIEFVLKPEAIKKEPANLVLDDFDFGRAWKEDLWFVSHAFGTTFGLVERLDKVQLYERDRPFPAFAPKAEALLSFFHDRLKVYLKDQGVRHDVIDACLAMPGNDDLTLLVKRATALSETLKTEDGANLLQGFKRANNILSQAEAKDGVEYSFGAELKFAETEEERALFAALDKAEATITPAMAQEDFGTAMAAMAALRGPIDAFFTAVQVNSDNQIVRRNRLNLLHRIRAVCSGVADLTRIEG
jgi:glycyl-tRNA synthetase beta chain